MANKSNVEAQKMLKKLISQIQELQSQLEDEQRHREEFRENYLIAEKKLQVALSEKVGFLLCMAQSKKNVNAMLKLRIKGPNIIMLSGFFNPSSTSSGHIFVRHSSSRGTEKIYP